MITPQLSGFCASPSTNDPEGSHARCRGGNTARPSRDFQPCPCACHLGEVYECGGCGRPIAEAPFWPNEDEPGEMVYVHIDNKGRAIAEECA